MDEGGLVCIMRLVAFQFSLSGDGRADFDEGGRDVGRCFMEGGVNVADGDANELDASPVSSEGAKKGVVLLRLLGEFLLASEVLAEAK